MKTTKYQVTVKARNASYLVFVVNDKEHDLVVFERINTTIGWKREIVVPSTDSYVMISGDSTGVRISGLKESKKIFSVGCNDVGDLDYYSNDLFEEPLQTNNEVSISLEDTLKQDPVLLNGVVDVFAKVLNETPFMEKLNAVRTIIKSVNDGLLINMNIVNNLDMTMKVGMDVEKIVTNYKSTHPTSTEDDIVKHVIEYCRLNTIPNYVQQALEQGMTPDEICKKHVLTRQDVDWYLWLFDAYDKLFGVSNKEREDTAVNKQGVKVDKDGFMTIGKISSEDKLSLLNAMIARIHDKHSVASIVNELNISTSIVTTVMYAYNSLKPISGGTTGNIYVLIDYIVKNRIVDSIKTSVEQNDTVEQTARFSNISIYEAEWLMWFVKASKENKKKTMIL